jgi:plasmid maintenance system antidote protein VapI
MSIHIGNLIQKEVERKRLTYKEFGALIHRNEKTIPDIYDRASMSTDLLLTISKALNTDFFAVFYSEEPLKSLRND